VTHPFGHKQIGEILVSKGYAGPADIQAVLDSHSSPIGEMLIAENKITPNQLAEAIAEQSSLPYIDLDDHQVPAALFESISAEDCYKYNVIPYRRDGKILHVVISDPFDLVLIRRLERLNDLHVQFAVSSRQAIMAALKRSEGTSAVLKDATEDFKFAMVVEKEDGSEQFVSLEEGAGENDSPVIRLINTLLLAAIQKGASDVHIERHEKGVEAKYRIDGILSPAMDTLDRSHHNTLVSRLKVMANLDIAEKRLPQDGRFKLRFNSRDIDFRISILPGDYGEDVVIRILDKLSVAGGAGTLRLGRLGFAENDLNRFLKCISEPYGMVLMTGPTGSGKTTTLYAALSELNTGDRKIITVEDPVEYELDGIIQIPINEKKGLTFSRGLRSILRHDPDIIMVGEIRDSETADIAIQAALTGHLLFSTVHANNAVDVIPRFHHMGVDIYDFVSVLNCVTSQRLIRRICPECKEEVRQSVDMLTRSGLDHVQYADQVWYAGKGCSYCGDTGFKGRSAITEILMMSPTLKQMILERRPTDELQETAGSEGMKTLRQSALDMVLAGETTLAEANRITFVGQ